MRQDDFGAATCQCGIFKINFGVIRFDFACYQIDFVVATCQCVIIIFDFAAIRTDFAKIPTLVFGLFTCYFILFTSYLNSETQAGPSDAACVLPLLLLH